MYYFLYINVRPEAIIYIFSNTLMLVMHHCQYKMVTTTQSYIHDVDLFPLFYTYLQLTNHSYIHDYDPSPPPIHYLSKSLIAEYKHSQLSSFPPLLPPYFVPVFK